MLETPSRPKQAKPRLRPKTDVSSIDPTDAPGPWLIVGLGNPGPEYAGNRHNIGFQVADELGQRLGGGFRRHKRARALVLEGHLSGDGGGVRAVLVKPSTYMNDSGQAVASLSDFYKTTPARVLAIHDELDLPFGAIRLKYGGGDNGHNGLKSLRGSLGTGDYFRARFGIGRPPGMQDPASFVLRDFAAVERKGLAERVSRTADAVEALINGGLERAQSHYND